MLCNEATDRSLRNTPAVGCEAVWCGLSPLTYSLTGGRILLKLCACGIVCGIFCRGKAGRFITAERAGIESTLLCKLSERVSVIVRRRAHFRRHVATQAAALRRRARLMPPVVCRCMNDPVL